MYVFAKIIVCVFLMSNSVHNIQVLNLISSTTVQMPHPAT